MREYVSLANSSSSMHFSSMSRTNTVPRVALPDIGVPKPRDVLPCGWGVMPCRRPVVWEYGRMVHRGPFGALRDAQDLVRSEARFRDALLVVFGDFDLSAQAEDLYAAARWEIDSFARENTRYASAQAAYDAPHSAPPLIKQLAKASAKANVPPFSAEEGAIAQYIAVGLSEVSKSVVVGVGAQLYLAGAGDRIVELSGGSCFGRASVGIRIPAGLQPVGVSLGEGADDAVCVMARDGALANAVAAGLAGRVGGPEDVERAIEAGRRALGVLGMLVIAGDTLGAWGNLKLTSASSLES